MGPTAAWPARLGRGSRVSVCIQSCSFPQPSAAAAAVTTHYPTVRKGGERLSLPLPLPASVSLPRSLGSLQDNLK